MLLPISDICKWLRESAATLRNGGAEASAVVYEEIADRLENESGAIRAAMRERVRGAIAVGVMNCGGDIIEALDKLGYAIVPKEWVE